MRLICGSVSSVVLSSTSPVDAFDVSMSGALRRRRYRLLDGADFEDDIEREELLRADARVLALERLEAGDRGADGVDRPAARRETNTRRRCC